jgi:hypothetical protein
MCSGQRFRRDGTRRNSKRASACEKKAGERRNLSLEKRIARLEDRMRLARFESGESVPIAVQLELSPTDFIPWYDHLLHSDSAWHTLSFNEKYRISFELNFKPGCNVPEDCPVSAVELLRCNVLAINLIDDAEEESGGDERLCQELLVEKAEAFKGSILKLAR